MQKRTALLLVIALGLVLSIWQAPCRADDAFGSLPAAEGLLRLDDMAGGRLGILPLTGVQDGGDWSVNTPQPQGSFGIQKEPTEAKGLGASLLRSLVLPGWGEIYLGAPNRGALFIGVEAAIWTTFAVFKVQENQRQDDYIEMAQVFAGVASASHDDNYWKAVGQHENWIDYNEYLRLEARREYGFGTPEYYQFIQDNEISEGDSWVWRSEDRLDSYTDKRKSSLNAERNATYTLYALLINRAISLVDTWRLWRTRESIRGYLMGSQSSLDIETYPTPEGLGWRVGWHHRF